ncbi:MAG: hypothetical protein ACE5FQ_06920 [Thiogranum sp.]
MAEIGQLPPAYRVPPGFPGKGPGDGKQAPQRKPDSERRQSDPHPRRRKQDDDEHGIDEYA